MAGKACRSMVGGCTAGVVACLVVFLGGLPYRWPYISRAQPQAGMLLYLCYVSVSVGVLAGVFVPAGVPPALISGSQLLAVCYE